MIEFYGRLSEDCIKKTEKRKAKRAAFIFLIANLIILSLVYIYVIIGEMQLNIFLILVAFMVAINIAILIVPPKSIYFRLPRKIILYEKKITYMIEGLSKPKTRIMSRIREIIDEGEWYFLTFKGDITDTLVCQKSLIKKGTIEEFEKLFEGKIVRM